jgi:hypothetical protein
VRATPGITPVIFVPSKTSFPFTNHRRKSFGVLVRLFERRFVGDLRLVKYHDVGGESLRGSDLDHED